MDTVALTSQALWAKGQEWTALDGRSELENPVLTKALTHLPHPVQGKVVQSIGMGQILRLWKHIEEGQGQNG